MQIDHIGAQRLALGFRLNHIAPRHNARFVLVIGQARRAVVGRHGFFQNLPLQIQNTQADITLCHGQLNRQTHCRQISGAALQAGFLGFHLTAHAAPNIRRPAQVQARGAAFAERRVVATAATLRHAQIETGEVVAAAAAPLGFGCAIAGFGLRQCLVGLHGLFDQRCQFGIAKYLPPVSGQRLDFGTGSLPAVFVFVVIGQRNIRCLIVGSDGAAGQQPCAEQAFQQQRFTGKSIHNHGRA